MEPTERSFYIVRNAETGATLKGYGNYGKSAPKLYLNYGTASMMADRYKGESRYQVVEVKLSEVEKY